MRSEWSQRCIEEWMRLIWSIPSRVMATDWRSPRSRRCRANDLPAVPGQDLRCKVCHTASGSINRHRALWRVIYRKVRVALRCTYAVWRRKWWLRRTEIKHLCSVLGLGRLSISVHLIVEQLLYSSQLGEGNIVGTGWTRACRFMDLDVET